MLKSKVKTKGCNLSEEDRCRGKRNYLAQKVSNKDRQQLRILTHAYSTERDLTKGIALHYFEDFWE